jgi:hypothetical protein
MISRVTGIVLLALVAVVTVIGPLVLITALVVAQPKAKSQGRRRRVRAWKPSSRTPTDNARPTTLWVHKLLWVGTSGSLLLLGGALIRVQRAALGEHQASVLLGAELLAGVLLATAAWLWTQRERSAALVMCQVGGAILLAVLGWLAHPDRVVERASTRVADARRQLREYELAQADPVDRDGYRLRPDDPPRQRAVRSGYAVEIRARQLEATALTLRLADNGRHPGALLDDAADLAFFAMTTAAMLLLSAVTSWMLSGTPRQRSPNPQPERQHADTRRAS